MSPLSLHQNKYRGKKMSQKGKDCFQQYFISFGYCYFTFLHDSSQKSIPRVPSLLQRRVKCSSWRLRVCVSLGHLMIKRGSWCLEQKSCGKSLTNISLGKLLWNHELLTFFTGLWGPGGWRGWWTSARLPPAKWANLVIFGHLGLKLKWAIFFPHNADLNVAYAIFYPHAGKFHGYLPCMGQPYGKNCISG